MVRRRPISRPKVSLLRAKSRGTRRSCDQSASEKASYYQLFRENAHHPSLQFKKVHQSDPIYSARVTLGYRALGLLDQDEIAWFWIGTHAAYDRLLENL